MRISSLNGDRLCVGINGVRRDATCVDSAKGIVSDPTVTVEQGLLAAGEEVVDGGIFEGRKVCTSADRASDILEWPGMSITNALPVRTNSRRS